MKSSMRAAITLQVDRDCLLWTTAIEPMASRHADSYPIAISALLRHRWVFARLFTCGLNQLTGRRSSRDSHPR